VGLIDVERAFFAFSHETVGAAVLDNWNLSTLMIQSALHHHDLALTGTVAPELKEQVAVVNLAGLLCRHLGIGQESPDEQADIENSPGASILDLDEDQIEDIQHDLENLFARERDFFLVSTR
jgi:HD-like signal output (HDOD) protein